LRSDGTAAYSAWKNQPTARGGPSEDCCLSCAWIKSGDTPSNNNAAILPCGFKVASPRFAFVEPDYALSKLFAKSRERDYRKLARIAWEMTRPLTSLFDRFHFGLRNLSGRQAAALF